MSQPTSPVCVAVVQFDPQVGLDNRESNLHRSLALAAEAVNGGANLIVLPELSNCGYFFSSRQDAFEHAEPVPGGASVQAWMAFAATHQVYLVAGLNEIEGRQLFNTAVLLGPDGLIGKYRKAHLWNLEKLWFTPGNLGFPVFETPIGRIGLLICWDIWFPEVPRILSQQGADIICSLNNWVWTPPPLFDEAGKCMASYLTMTAAHVNNVFIAAASRIGEERDARYLGCSLIAGTNGWPIGKVASANHQEILFADIDLTSARSAPIWNSLNDLHRDRRDDLYDQMLGYCQHPALPR
ncbi:nitrilase family protein [Pseudomonas sp. MF6772]|uniref:nitrilase family protein n=1 Tax=Pseudomonas TaxID=286 RepID=UPI0014741D87|nr:MULTISPECIES: nitrilase family protein [Pseudomonas]MBJ2268644.1 nitrilase family protein [Pseudomonas sp. MF6772]MBL7229746.1 nitrilase family protein [Pseudomonas sp.]MCM8563558.1 nitrilase family protein [Pseudomonas shahriarae]MCU0209593.1 nitrilase family protein [Pseudomonas shahriarae]NMY22921.1 hydratase [Pseudomonas sp. WS 5410]